MEGAPPRTRRRWPWFALAALVALAIATRTALPWAIARGIESGAESALGLPIEIGNVDLGLFRGAVRVEDVAVGHAGQGAREKPLLRVTRLSARLAWPSLFAGRLQLRELALEQPVLRFARLADGSLENPLPAQPSEAPEPEASGGAGWPLAVDELRVAGLDLELSDPGRDAPALGFALEELSLRDVVLEGHDLTLGGVGVRGPRLRVERSFVFGAPGAAAAESAAPPGPEAPAAEAPAAAPATPRPPAPGRRYRLERVAIDNARISLLTEGEPLDLELDFEAEGVSARAGETFPLTLDLRVGGGEVRAEGRAGLAPPTFDGTLRWSELPVPLFVLAARPELAPWVRSCRAEGELSVTARLEPGADPAETADLRLAGRFAVRDLALADPEEAEVEICWSALEVGVRETSVPLGASERPIRVQLAEVRLEGPALRYARPTPALDALFGTATPGDEAGAAGSAEEATPPAAPPEPAAAEESGPPLELEIDALEVRSGSFAFRDETLAEPYAGALTRLSVSARDVRWPALRANGLRVRGVAPERAPFSLTGDLDGARGRFAFEVQRLALPRLDPYAATAGYRFARGEATLRTQLVLDPERYATANDLRLHDIRLDSADAGAFERQFGTSLDFALALLRDPSGDIRLPVPVVVERENLRLGLGRIVLGALRAALVGVVSSPLKALGAALPRGGAGDVDLASLPTEPGSAEIAADAGERVEALAELLRSRPLLAVELVGRSGPGDRAVLAERLAVERATAGEPLPEVEGSGFFARRRIAEALRARGRGEAPELSAEDEALRERTIAALDVPAERFEALARERAAKLREHLVGEGGAPAEHVHVAERVAEGEPGIAIELVAEVKDVVAAETPAAEPVAPEPAPSEPPGP